jgi:hypothetical protein
MEVLQLISRNFGSRSSSWLETGQSNSEVSHQIIEIRYEIPNQVRKQVNSQIANDFGGKF